MAKKKKRSMAGFILVVVMLAVLGVFAYYEFMHRQQQSQKKDQTPKTEVEKLIAKDIEGGYPETPVEVMKLWGRVDQCLYNNPMDDDQFEKLVGQLRVFYSKELIGQNEEKAHIKKLRSEVGTFRKNKNRIVSYSAETGTPVSYKDVQGRECAKVRVSFFMNHGSGYVKQYQDYVLVKEDGKWKVLGFRKVAGDTSVSKEEALGK